MKKIIAIFMLVIMIALCLSACGAEVESVSQQEKSMFIQIESTYSWKVVYHLETKVMYAVSNGSYNYGTFTLLVNADGTPMLYQGDN